MSQSSNTVKVTSGDQLLPSLQVSSKYCLVTAVCAEEWPVADPAVVDAYPS